LSFYYLIGIAGTAMASLAVMLRSTGHRVEGSDEGVYPPMSDLLAREGITYHGSFDARHIESIEPDAVIVGNAVGRGNPELEAALDRNLPYTSLPSVLFSEFMSEKRRIALAGTHGKTTTTGMVAWGLQSAGFSPSFMAGGIPENFGVSYGLGEGDHFVVEADEYDTAYFDKGPKFFHYRPHMLAITSVEHDHPDIYPDAEAVSRQFALLVRIVPASGYITVNADSSRALSAVENAWCDVETYGLAEGVDWRAADLKRGPGFDCRFDILHRERKLGRVTLHTAGEYNILNSLAAAALLARCGVSGSDICRGLSSFRGVRRRLTTLCDSGGILLLDDFAHHPTAIKASLAGVREAWPERRLWVLFEPRSWATRRNIFQDTLADALSVADRVVIGPVYRAGSAPGEELDPEEVASQVRSLGAWAAAEEEPSRIADMVLADAKPGDIIVVQTNGSFGGLGEMLRINLGK